MKKIFIINGHEEYEFSKGELNKSLVERLTYLVLGEGFEIKTTTMKDKYNIDEEIEKHQWADVIVLQMPVNWMATPWSLKKYQDYVYSFGMDGRLCAGDGRTRQDTTKQYGSGGTLNGKKYMLSLTFNAPKEAFENRDQVFFEGKSVDDLFLPTHLNFKFFGMDKLPTFAAYDVMKNPDIENDFVKFEEHIKANILNN
ncbi:flavodoxin [Tenacibaculum sp. SZ-18]|uniref:NAD(P)H-dependent oxidoreductase n=1 Tax=Tenacibaculum sp. SZ-18 TaxID=754423 RepID=UPI000C2D53E7|nr:NAD(P)H-dependent oxidoreductase [Tenacibaculum sp. SZ-18]AUC14208.1 flavodoxin [Tenacibaculum sp. SZ-18]